MKNIAFIFLFLFPLIGFGQEIPEELKSSYTDNFCTCYDQLRDLDDQKFITCLEEKNLPLQDDIFIAFNKTEFSTLEEFGEFLMISCYEKIFMNCDNFYNDLKNKVFSALDQEKKNFGEIDVQKLNDDIQNNPNEPSLYFLKGLNYFKLGDNKSAEENLLKSNELMPDNMQGNYILALVSELNGNYERAMTLFDDLYKNTKENSFLFNYYIAKRQFLESFKN